MTSTQQPIPVSNVSGAPGPQQPFSSASLYVGDLSPDVTEALLFEVFNTVGPVVSIRVCRDNVTRRSLGYGYVNFHNTADAERALDTMNYTSIRGRPCRIMWCQRDPSLRKTGAGNVFVKNLDASTDNKALYDTFSLFGNILSCKVVCDKEGRSLGYGFVHYETLEAAEEAIRKLNNMLISGKPVYVGHFLPRMKRMDTSKWTNIYVKNVPEAVNQAQLVTFFSSFGPITSAVLMLGPDGNNRGFGFVNFEQHESAKHAVEDANGKYVSEDLTRFVDAPTEEEEKDGGRRRKAMYVGRAQKKSEREKELKAKFEALKLERLRKYEGVNLYVKNLDESVDDERLRQEFSRFGNITSARVMKDESNGVSKGFGFVCFSTPDEATAVITEMNGKLLAGKPLYVNLAQRKEARRAALEAQMQQRAVLPRGGPVAQGMYPPMYYQGGAPQQFMFPQGQVPPGMQGGMPFQQYHPMPYMGARGRGGRGGASRGGHPRPGVQPHVHAQALAHAAAVQQQQQQQQHVQFTAAARNMQPQAPQPVALPQVIPTQQQMVQQLTGLEPLTPSQLAAASSDQQKNMIGERLYPLIAQIQPELAGKITGMLLEMDNGELLHLLESPESMMSKIQEALLVLDAHRET